MDWSGRSPCGSVDLNAYTIHTYLAPVSLPLWERGFKRYISLASGYDFFRRSPCGSVDLNKTADWGTYEVNPSLPLWECKEK